ncbi:capsule biosynthesis GfcC family protein [Salinimonas sediminis]|uniref:Uncharacterized protein n=1 Tax=Salinimonas sediminis TaxID=2303538 RepID=A0A346NRX7_9ALTE|nr:capsule biosynthesis GfcC family protein [Salinimonas sediminis]AXR08284.1 hypothetical protein D0Y50_19150 [Salinimonas sediminis]
MRIFSLLMLILFSVNTSAQVNLKINNQQYRFLEPVRLAHALAPVAHNQDWYWPASGLFIVDESVEEQRNEVIELIDKLAIELEPTDDRAIGLHALRQQIEGWKLAKRVPLKVNYDVARLNISQNPKLLEGDYLLTLTPRPEVVHLSGLVKTPGPYKHQPAGSAYQYTQAIELRADADPDFVYIIEPSGRLRNVNTAYWNRQYTQVMPGSQIFVPIFSYLLTPSLSELNQKVAELAVNRVL